MITHNMNDSNIRIVIVDDNEMMRYAFRKLMNYEKNFEVCSEASTPEEGMTAIENAKPDIALVDMSLDGPDSGLLFIREARKKFPALILVGFSIHEASTHRALALEAGADEFINKTEGVNQIGATLRTLYQQKRPA
jgi:DNA-binding NarL/FixJ family response regulator